MRFLTAIYKPLTFEVRDDAAYDWEHDSLVGSIQNRQVQRLEEVGLTHTEVSRDEKCQYEHNG